MSNIGLKVGSSLIIFSLLYLVCIKAFTKYKSLHKYTFLIAFIGTLIIAKSTNNNYSYIFALINATLLLMIFLFYFL